jgi:LPPG:FO 2-phospho-L-lactate transferase
VGGKPVKGPADSLLRGVGAEVSARGVAALYADWIGGFVIDERDARESSDVEALGLRCVVTDTIMRDAKASARVARAALDLAARL